MNEATIDGLPKIHLHCHLEGALRAATFLDLTDKYGVSTRYRPGGEPIEGPRTLDDVYRFGNFGEFLLLFAAVSRSLASPEDYGRLAREFVADAAAQNVVYGELFISPSAWQFFHPTLDVRAAVEAIVSELRRGDAQFSLIVDLTRNFGAEGAMRTAQLAVSLEDLDVIGIGLGGDEARFPAELFGDAFAFARAHGLHTVAHAGEAAGAPSVRAAIEIGAERIGHGVLAMEDPDVVALLRDRKIPLELCPTSNFLTGAADRNAIHPLVELDKAGVIVTIDADDPTLFGTTIADEYRYVAEYAGLDALKRYIANAVDSSFLFGEAKRALRARVNSALQ